MEEETVPTVRRYTAVIVTCMVGLFVVLIVLRGAAGLLADSKRARVLGAWAGSLGSFEEILERHPDREVNQSALRVEELSAALGIDVTPRFVVDRARPTDAAESRYRQARIAIGFYANQQLERRGPASEPPPPEVAAYLSEHYEILAELRRQLIEEDAPRWSSLLGQPHKMPVPNLHGLVQLQRLLVAEAMFRAAAGDSERALATLEASWQLNTALRDDPLLVTQLIGLDIAEMQVGALRHVERVPRSWKRRLYEHDFRASVLTSLQVEGWAWMQVVDPPARDRSEGTVVELIHAVAGPYLSYCAVDVSEDWRQRLVEFSELDSFCDRDLESSGISLNVDSPVWNLPGRKLWIGELDEIPKRLARYELNREMTAKLLELRWARNASGGHWPTSLPGIEQSPTCPDDCWVYTSTPGGEVSLAFSRSVEWTGLRGAKLPLRYVASP